MKSVTRMEDAYKLPEKSLFSYKEERQFDGTIMNIPHWRNVVAVDLSDDTILFFVDKDGRRMLIEYDTEGAYKTPVEEG